MTRPRIVAVVVGIGAMVIGTVLTEWLAATATDPAAQAQAEMIGFAVSTPAGLVLLTYVADEFDFDGYFGGRGAAQMFGDFILTILGGGVVGLVVTTVGLGTLGPGLGLYIATGICTFAAAFGVFYFQTRSYFGHGN